MVLVQPRKTHPDMTIKSASWDVNNQNKQTSKLGPSINGLDTNRNTKLCCRGFILAHFETTTDNKIDSEHTQDYKRLLLVCKAEILRVTVK